MAKEKAASFLGIPRETRQYIYDYVIHLDLNYEVVKLYKDGWGDGGFSTVMYKHPVETLTVPWLNLLLTCKSVNSELGAYMNSPFVLGDEDNRTYTMDIFASSRGVLRSSTWQRIPCSPSSANSVSVNIQIEYPKHDKPYRRVRTWGCGGPMPILRQLYQTLNLLLHNGPILSRASPLQHPLKLKNLDINATATSGGTPDTPQADHGLNPPETGIGCRLVTLKDTGLLQGYVDLVRINDGKGYAEIPIEAVEDAGVPGFWDRYGFEWGHDHSASVQWESFDEKCLAKLQKKASLG
ncbi:hypothetical protein F4859DRAFT_485438 [Xylaria cf. heliscus]|nr:hypothetical protein F4859DRAFT_485438 [Xylaria cf. heliscus]